MRGGLEVENLTLQTLEQYDGAYLSIGITEGGRPRRCIGVPWDRTVTAMNMRLPQLYLSEEEIQDPQILARLQNYKVCGVYIFIPLQDYSFLAEFPWLEDVNIRQAQNLSSLEFLRGKPWKMLYLENAHLADLAPAFEPRRTGKPEKEGMFFALPHHLNLALCDCEVDEVKDICGDWVRFSELLIFHRGKEEKERWKKARVNTFKYYERKEENV